MTTLLAIALALLALALLSVRQPSDTYAAPRTPAQLMHAARRAGRRRIALTAGRVILVVILLLLVEACRLSLHAAAAAGLLLLTLAHGIELLAGPAQLAKEAA